MTEEQRQSLLDNGFEDIVLDENKIPDWNRDFKDPFYVFNLKELKSYKIDPSVIRRF